MEKTSKPRSCNFSVGRMFRPSKTKAGFCIVRWMAAKSRARNSAHSVSTATAWAPSTASMALEAMTRRASSQSGPSTSRRISSVETLGSYTTTTAFSSNSSRTTEMAGDSRVSFVSFLKAKPSTAIRLPLTVLKRVQTIFFVKRDFCQSFIRTTASQ